MSIKIWKISLIQLSFYQAKILLGKETVMVFLYINFRNFFSHVEWCNEQADEEIVELDLYFQVSIARTRCTVHIAGEISQLQKMWHKALTEQLSSLRTGIFLLGWDNAG